MKRQAAEKSLATAFDGTVEIVSAPFAGVFHEPTVYGIVVDGYADFIGRLFEYEVKFLKPLTNHARSLLALPPEPLRPPHEPPVEVAAEPPSPVDTHVEEAKSQYRAAVAVAEAARVERQKWDSVLVEHRERGHTLDEGSIEASINSLRLVRVAEREVAVAREKLQRMGVCL